MSAPMNPNDQRRQSRVNLAINPERRFKMKITPMDRAIRRLNKMEQLRRSWQEFAELYHYVPLPLRPNLVFRVGDDSVCLTHDIIVAAFSDKYDALSEHCLTTSTKERDVGSKAEDVVRPLVCTPYYLLNCDKHKKEKLELMAVHHVFQFLYDGAVVITFANIPSLLKVVTFLGVTELRDPIGKIMLRFVDANEAKYLPLCLHLTFEHDLNEQCKSVLVSKVTDRLQQMIESLQRNPDITVKSVQPCESYYPLTLTLYEVRGDAIIRVLLEDHRRRSASGEPASNSNQLDYEIWQKMKFDFVINWLDKNPNYAPIYARGLIKASCIFDDIDLKTAYECLDKASLAGLMFFVRNKIVKADWKRQSRKIPRTRTGAILCSCSADAPAPHGPWLRCDPDDSVVSSQKTSQLLKQLNKLVKKIEKSTSGAGQRIPPSGTVLSLPELSPGQLSVEDGKVTLTTEDYTIPAPTADEVKDKWARHLDQSKEAPLLRSRTLREIMTQDQLHIFDQLPYLLNKKGRRIFQQRLMEEDPAFTSKIAAAIVKYAKMGDASVKYARSGEATDKSTSSRRLHSGKKFRRAERAPAMKFFFYTPVIEVHDPRRVSGEWDRTESIDGRKRYGSFGPPMELDETGRTMSGADEQLLWPPAQIVQKGRPLKFMYSYCEMIEEPSSNGVPRIVKTTKYVLKRVNKDDDKQRDV